MECNSVIKIEEIIIKEIHQAFAENKLTARKLVNPEAQNLADEADLNRGNKGELHGIPVLVKDTFGTKDQMNTSAGSYALLGAEVARDAGVVDKLRKAGAIVLGKASMSEWYKFRSLTGVPNGWCARSGQRVNPYCPSGSPCGLSSGCAISVAANMVAVSLGTETHCSIICPADHNSVVGLKPTVGLTSRAAIIPMTPLWDTVGRVSICRNVSNAVYMLDVIVGSDPRDEVTTEAAKYIPEGGYKQFLREDGMERKRIGIVRHPLVEMIHGAIEKTAFEHHLDLLRQEGATLVDNLRITHIEEIMDPNHSGEALVMMVEFKSSINAYLKELITSPVRSLADIIAFNERNSDLEKLKEYDQHTFIEAEKTGHWLC
ncbi:putative amidase [Capsicum galapagoense]